MPKISLEPELLPLLSVASEGVVPVSELTAEKLRQRFAHAPDWNPEVNDEHLLAAGKEFRAAAVLIALVQREQGLSLLLTRRTAHLQNHAGQISFPGGRVEDSDSDAVAAALRESEEEISLARRCVEVIGLLPDYFTGTGYQVTPVVAIVTPPLELRPDPFEVAEIFEVPLSFLMDAQHHQRRIYTPPVGVQRTFYAMPYHQYFIWGATAGMLRNLFHFLRAPA